MKPALLLLALTLIAAPVAAQTNLGAQPRPATLLAADYSCTIHRTAFLYAPALAPAPPQAKPAAQTGGSPLEKVLNSMDAAAAKFQTAQADFVWDQYESVVKEHTNQAGVIYFRRTSKGTDMAADITQPPAEQKYVLFTEGIVRLYQPKIDQVTEYKAGKNRAEFESFLVLGFGGRGHDLPKSFDVKYAGTEDVGGIKADKLELSPKAQKVRQMFDRIVLWIDPARGVSVQQQFFEPASGNYRLAKYSNIKMNQKIPDSVFKLKTTPNTKVVTPQS